MTIDYDTLFCFVDDFCKGFEPWYKKQLISDGTVKRNRKHHLRLSEALTIFIAYHQSEMSCFKYFYLDLFNLSMSKLSDGGYFTIIDGPRDGSTMRYEMR